MRRSPLITHLQRHMVNTASSSSREERVAAEQFDRLSALGASPDEVADIVVSGMRSGRFYILTSENRNDAVTRRGTEIISGGPPAVPFP